MIKKFIQSISNLQKQRNENREAAEAEEKVAEVKNANKIKMATDPGTVPPGMDADENLYAIVFGESIFNDAIGIVMY